MRTLIMLLLSCVMTACAVDASEGPEDEDLDFSGEGDGKGDTDRLVEGTPLARGVLRVANEVSYEDLEHEAKIGFSAANNIIAYRRGYGSPGPVRLPYAEPTDAEGNPLPNKRNFKTLAELDERPWVIAVTFSKLSFYAQTHGFVVEDEPAPTENDAETEDEDDAE